MYGAYLRKSRADLDLEKNSGVDTLKRHRDLIENTAKMMNITIDKWWQEVVSGETIEARPEVQKMLLEVEQGFFEGIIVVDVDRLARGDTADQARISKSFSYSNTKIITPSKIYDPNNDDDEAYFEFGLFMSRREYKTINKRLNRGRLASVNEGKFVGSVCPFGYTKEKIKGQKGYKLVIDQDESDIVKIIFDLASKGMGASNIANHLNKIGAKPRKIEIWVSASIRSIIHNPVYYGMITWNYRKTVRRITNGVVYKSRPKQKDFTLVRGLHDPIISKEIWDLANKNNHVKEGKSVKKSLTLQNPLAGLIECGYCHRTMQRRNYRSGHLDGLICPLPHCQNIGSHLYLVEDAIFEALGQQLKEYEQILVTYKKDSSEQELDTNNITLIEKEIEKTNQQLNRTYDLLEQGLYDNNIFIERNNFLKQKINDLEREKEKYSYQSQKRKFDSIKKIIPKLQYLLTNYSSDLSPEERNELLKSAIKRVYYKKIVKGRGHENEFQIQIDIKL